MTDLRKFFRLAIKESNKFCNKQGLRSIIILEWQEKRATFEIEFVVNGEYQSKEIVIKLENNED